MDENDYLLLTDHERWAVIHERLRSSTGQEPIKEDVQWEFWLEKEDVLKKQEHWIQLGMLQTERADYFAAREQYGKASFFHLMGAFFEVNGPALNGRSLEGQSMPAGIAQRIQVCLQEAMIDKSTARALFLKEAPDFQVPAMSLSIEESWKKISDSIWPEDAYL